MQDETTYILEPTAFHSMTEAQVLTDQLEQNLSHLSNVAANIKPQVVEIFSEMVNNAAEHGMSDTGAHCHVISSHPLPVFSLPQSVSIGGFGLMPHRKGLALDSVITDRGPGIRATLERNPDLQVESDEQALRLAVQELTSGTGNPTRGIGLWTTFLECQKPGRKLQVHSGTGRLTVYGPDSVEFSTTIGTPGNSRHHRPVHDPHLTSKRPSSNKRPGIVLQQPSNAPRGCLPRKCSPPAVNFKVVEGDSPNHRNQNGGHDHSLMVKRKLPEAVPNPKNHVPVSSSEDRAFEHRIKQSFVGEHQHHAG